MSEALKVGSAIGIDDHEWRVRGIHLGAEGQESIIELECISHKPGWTAHGGHNGYHYSMFVPEILLRKRKYWIATE